MTEHEADLIRASFRAVGADQARAAEVFYRHLFELDPATRHLFVGDMTRQGVKLMSTLGMIVARLQEWEMLRPVVEDLALRHLAYGVRPAHYPSVGLAVARMLEEIMEAEFTDDHASAWARAFAELQSAMISAAYPPSEPPPPDSLHA